MAIDLTTKRQKQALFILTFITAMVLSYRPACSTESPQRSARTESLGSYFARIFKVFDFDDTIMFTTAKIYIYDKNGREIGISTRDFAEIGELVSKDLEFGSNLLERLKPDLRKYFTGVEVSDLKDYKLDLDETKSFRDFRSKPGQNIFLEKLIETLNTKTDADWMGPRWKSFVKACETAEGAQAAFIISARGHTPADVLAGLEYLKERGFLKFVPPIENLFLVGGNNLPELGKSSEEKKTNAVKKLLDRLEQMVSKDRMMPRKGFLVFSDDDFQNIKKMMEGLEGDLSRWPNLKIVLDYVGEVNPENTAQEYVLKSEVVRMCSKVFKNAK